MYQILFFFAISGCGLLAIIIYLKQEKLSQKMQTIVRLETELKAEKERAELEKNIWQESQAQLQDRFKSLASQALEGNTQQFLHLAKTSLAKEAQVARTELDNRKDSINDLLKPLKETLDKYQTQLNGIERERQRSYTIVEQELKKVIETSHNLSQETTALKNALKKPHVRGRWGEVQLKNCIELAGMSEFADVTFQDATNLEEEGRIIPDMTVRMPGGHLVIVDAKTPIEAFISSLEATSEDARQKEMTRHARHVKEHVKSLSAKAYSDSLVESADFTIMFLPNESFLYAALESEPNLMEFALERKILIATPPTLIGLLKVIRYGWNEEKLATNALNISKAGKELHKRVSDFLETYQGVGQHLDKAKIEYDKGMTRLKSRVLVEAYRLEKLGAKSKKDLPANEQTPCNK